MGIWETVPMHRFSDLIDARANVISYTMHAAMDR